MARFQRNVDHRCFIVCWLILLDAANGFVPLFRVPRHGIQQSRCTASSEDQGDDQTQNQQSLSGVYALRLEGDRYYVGKTTNFTARLNEHFTSGGSAWTRRYPPIEQVRLIVEPTSDLESTERAETLERMWLHGIENVRGWRYTTTAKLTEGEIEDAFNQLCERKDLCRKCGRDGHMIASCTSRDLAKWVGNNRLPNKEMILQDADTRKKRMAEGMAEKQWSSSYKRERKAVKTASFAETSPSWQSMEGGGGGAGAPWGIGEDFLLYTLHKDNTPLSVMEQEFDSRTPNALKSRIKRLLDPNHDAHRRLAPLLEGMGLTGARAVPPAAPPTPTAVTRPATSTTIPTPISTPISTPVAATAPAAGAASATVPVSALASVSASDPVTRSPVLSPKAAGANIIERGNPSKTGPSSQLKAGGNEGNEGVSSVVSGGGAVGDKRRVRMILGTAMKTFVMNMG